MLPLKTHAPPPSPSSTPCCLLQSLQSLQSLYLSQKHYYKCIEAVYKYIYFSNIKR